MPTNDTPSTIYDADRLSHILKSLLQRPIAFHRVFATITGGACPGLFLSQAWYWSQRTSDQDGWFYKTQEEWTEETALTRYEQETARKVLRRLGILEEMKRGLPCKVYYRINYNCLQASLLETNKLDSVKPTDLIDGNQQTFYITETTSETTSETTFKNPPIVPPGGLTDGDQGTADTHEKKPKRRIKTYFPDTPIQQEALRQSIFDAELAFWVEDHGITAGIAREWERFAGKAIANGYKYLNWRRAFMNWLTSDYQAQPKRTHVPMTSAETDAWARRIEAIDRQNQQQKERRRDLNGHSTSDTPTARPV